MTYPVSVCLQLPNVYVMPIVNVQEAYIIQDVNMSGGYILHIHETPIIKLQIDSIAF
jgi:hypothetical protein